MNEPPPKRPELATVICVYEIFAILVGIVIRFVTHALRANHPQIAYPPTPEWQTAATCLSYALALAGAITLWQMRPSAALFLTGRFAITLGWLAFNLWHGMPAGSGRLNHPTTVYLIVQAISLVFLTISGAIAWYTYHITARPSPSSPDTFHSGDRPAWPPQP